MKKSLTLIYIFSFVLTLQNVWAGNALTVKEQLNNLNKCWLDKHFDDEVLKECIPLNDDVSLIRMHLDLVEKKLRETDTRLLSANQQNKRNQCLNILHSYCERGVFPENIYHKERTPYFIDHLGTACAVGQLIISTGYEALAKKISSENNYAYISELNSKYPELKVWADEYGFELDELAWIQPGYQSCDTGCNVTAAIYPYSGTAPFAYLWSNGETTASISGLCFNTPYSCIVIDSTNDTITNIPFNTYIVLSLGVNIISNYIFISADPPVHIDLSATPDDGTCNGTALAKASGGDGNYTYYWSPGGQNKQTATGLCPGVYTVRVNSSRGVCVQTDSIEVVFSTSLPSLESSDFIISPNPASDKITVNGYKLQGKQARMEMYNIFGERVFQSAIIKPESKIDVSSFADGVYFVQVISKEEIFRGKMIVKRP